MISNIFSLVNFDFHHECRNMNWTKLYELIKDLNEWITGFGSVFVLVDWLSFFRTTLFRFADFFAHVELKRKFVKLNVKRARLERIAWIV